MTSASSPPDPLPIDEALALIARYAAPLGAEAVPLEAAHGRFLAVDVSAAISLPPFDSSAMDGFALRAADAPGRLRVVGESAAGAPFSGSLDAGDAVAISTGAVIPAEADAVVAIEETRTGDGWVEVPAGVRAGSHVRSLGSDIGRGEQMLAAGTRIGPAQIGAAAAVGIAALPCHRLPRVAVVATGDELRAPGEELGSGEIYNSNAPMLRAALATAAADVELIASAIDSRGAHRAALARALEHDLVITTGGVSVGPHDLVRSVERELGVEEVFWRVALRPGKPLMFGVRSATLVFGLPGNPVSTLVCFELFVRPALLRLQGARDLAPRFRRGVLACAVERNPERDDLIRVRLAAGDGAPVLQPLAGQQSHQIAVTAQADALARIPAGSGSLPPGAEVDYLALHGF